MDIGKLYFESRATEEERTAAYHCTEELLPRAKPPLCDLCLGLGHPSRHRAEFKLFPNGQSEVSLCFCCYMEYALSRTWTQEYVYGPSHLSRFAYCERRSFGRFARYAQLINRWPRRWLEGYLVGTPADRETQRIVVHQPDNDGGMPGS